MPSSTDPNRYDPDYANVLSYMEEGATPIKIKRPSAKSAFSFRARLYTYAKAWKEEGLKLAKTNPELSQACFERARIMARYNLQLEGNYVVCENRDSENYPISEISVGPERVVPLTTANLEKAKEDFINTAPKPVSNPALDEYEAVYRNANAKLEEAKKKLKEIQVPPKHPELRPRAYSFDRPTAPNEDNKEEPK